MSQDALSILNGRTKRLGNSWAYKLQEGQYALDTAFAKDLEIDTKRMSITFPFADGTRRDGVGDLLEVGGINTERHRLNPIVLFDHGKQVVLPIGKSEDPETGEYTVKIDPVSKTAWVKSFFYQADKLGNNSDHALFCEQLFDLMVKKFVRGGSIGYQVISARELYPDYETGLPKGLHLLSTRMLEASAVVMPANQDTVRKSLPDLNEVLCKDRLICGKPLSPILVKSLGSIAPVHNKSVVGGFVKGLKGEELEKARNARHNTQRQYHDPQATPEGDDKATADFEDRALKPAQRAYQDQQRIVAEAETKARLEADMQSKYGADWRENNVKSIRLQVRSKSTDSPEIEEARQKRRDADNAYVDSLNQDDLDLRDKARLNLSDAGKLLWQKLEDKRRQQRTKAIDSRNLDPNERLAAHQARASATTPDELSKARLNYQDVVVKPDARRMEEAIRNTQAQTKSIRLQGRQKSHDLIQGGRADNRDDSKFDPKALARGIKVEMEHTNDPKIAKEIAKDHLTERADYYDILQRVEGTKSVNSELDKARAASDAFLANRARAIAEGQSRDAIDKASRDDEDRWKKTSRLYQERAKERDNVKSIRLHMRKKAVHGEPGRNVPQYFGPRGLGFYSDETRAIGEENRPWHTNDRLTTPDIERLLRGDQITCPECHTPGKFTHNIETVPLETGGIVDRHRYECPGQNCGAVVAGGYGDPYEAIFGVSQGPIQGSQFTHNEEKSVKSIRLKARKKATDPQQESSGSRMTVYDYEGAPGGQWDRQVYDPRMVYEMARGVTSQGKQNYGILKDYLEDTGRQTSYGNIKVGDKIRVRLPGAGIDPYPAYLVEPYYNRSEGTGGRDYHIVYAPGYGARVVYHEDVLPYEDEQKAISLTRRRQRIKQEDPHDYIAKSQPVSGQLNYQTQPAPNTAASRQLNYRTQPPVNTQRKINLQSRSPGQVQKRPVNLQSQKPVQAPRRQINLQSQKPSVKSIRLQTRKKAVPEAYKPNWDPRRYASQTGREPGSYAQESGYEPFDYAVAAEMLRSGNLKVLRDYMSDHAYRKHGGEVESDEQSWGDRTPDDVVDSYIRNIAAMRKPADVSAILEHFGNHHTPEAVNREALEEEIHVPKSVEIRYMKDRGHHPHVTQNFIGDEPAHAGGWSTAHPTLEGAVAESYRHTQNADPRNIRINKQSYVGTPDETSAMRFNQEYDEPQQKGLNSTRFRFRKKAEASWNTTKFDVRPDRGQIQEQFDHNTAMRMLRGGYFGPLRDYLHETGHANNSGTFTEGDEVEARHLQGGKPIRGVVVWSGFHPQDRGTPAETHIVQFPEFEKDDEFHGIDEVEVGDLSHVQQPDTKSIRLNARKKAHIRYESLYDNDPVENAKRREIDERDNWIDLGEEFADEAPTQEEIDENNKGLSKREAKESPETIEISPRRGRYVTRQRRHNQPTGPVNELDLRDDVEHARQEALEEQRISQEWGGFPVAIDDRTKRLKSIRLKIRQKNATEDWVQRNRDIQSLRSSPEALHNYMIQVGPTAGMKTMKRVPASQLKPGMVIRENHNNQFYVVGEMGKYPINTPGVFEVDLTRVSGDPESRVQFRGGFGDNDLVNVHYDPEDDAERLYGHEGSSGQTYAEPKSLKSIRLQARKNAKAYDPNEDHIEITDSGGLYRTRGVVGGETHPEMFEDYFGGHRRASQDAQQLSERHAREGKPLPIHDLTSKRTRKQDL